MLIENVVGYQFPFDEYSEDFMLLSYWELRRLAFDIYDKEFAEKMAKEKGINNFENTLFTKEDLKDVRIMKRETFEAFVKECEIERSFLYYSSDEMIQNLDKNNPYSLKDFAFKEVPILNVIKNEYVTESYTTSKYDGKLEELPKDHYAWKHVDAIKKNPFLADKAYKEDFELVADGESWGLLLKYSDPSKENSSLFVAGEDVEFYLNKYKDIDYSKVRNKGIEKENVVDKLNINKSKEAKSNKEKENKKDDLDISQEEEENEITEDYGMDL